MDSTAAFARLGRIKLAETDLHGVLLEVADLAKETITGADEVSVTLVQGGRAHTAVQTGKVALELDERQYELGRGPCLDASMTAAPLSVPDLRAEQRWSDWAADAVQAGMGSSLSIGLPIQEALTGALNIYAYKAGAFDEAAIVVAENFAAYAAVALANAHLYDSAATLAQQMRAAMQHRAVIEQAKGIIMGDRRCGPDEAFAVLARLSQDTNRKIRDVAAALVESAMTPPGR